MAHLFFKQTLEKLNTLSGKIHVGDKRSPTGTVFFSRRQISTISCKSATCKKVKLDSLGNNINQKCRANRHAVYTCGIKKFPKPRSDRSSYPKGVRVLSSKLSRDDPSFNMLKKRAKFSKQNWRLCSSLDNLRTTVMCANARCITHDMSFTHSGSPESVVAPKSKRAKLKSEPCNQSCTAGWLLLLSNITRKNS